MFAVFLHLCYCQHLMEPLSFLHGGIPMTSFLCHIPPIEGAICCLVVGTKETPHVQLRHCLCVSAVKTLFKYNLKETIHIYNLIKQYLKHEKIWRKNVLLKQKVMLISRKAIVKRPRRDKRKQPKTCLRL